MVIKLRNIAVELYKEANPYVEDYSVEWMSSHTLFIRGMLKSDSKGGLLETILNETLEKHGGRVINLKLTDQVLPLTKKIRSIPTTYSAVADKVLVVQDLQRFTRLEEKRENLEDSIYFSGSRQSLFEKLCSCKKKTDEFYQMEIEKCEQKMQTCLSDDFKSSGYAYVVFDSYKSMFACLQEFQESTFDQLKAGLQTCKKV